MAINNTINDKFLSLTARPNASQSVKTPNRAEESGEADTAAGRNTSMDSLDLSQAGKRRQQSITLQTDASGSAPATPDQAKALAARISQQFELTGGQALSAHSVQGNQLELLLRSAPA